MPNIYCQNCLHTVPPELIDIGSPNYIWNLLCCVYCWKRWSFLYKHFAIGQLWALKARATFIMFPGPTWHVDAVGFRQWFELVICNLETDGYRIVPLISWYNKSIVLLKSVLWIALVNHFQIWLLAWWPLVNLEDSLWYHVNNPDQGTTCEYAANHIPFLNKKCSLEFCLLFSTTGPIILHA